MTAFARWHTEPRTEALALQLLAPFACHGIVFASDTAGLSRMSRAHPLPIVLYRIHQPKQRIHRAASALGGQAIGCWFADNTATFFPTPRDPAVLLRAMAAVHDDGPVRIGIAGHSGRFWMIDGDIYGPDAETVLELAELHCRGGETRITPALHQLLHDTTGLAIHDAQAGPCGPTHPVELLEVEGVAGFATPGGSHTYPIPYGADVHARVVRLGGEHPAPLVEEFDGLYCHHRALLVAFRPNKAGHTAMVTLDNLVDNQGFQILAAGHLDTDERKIWQGLAIGAFETVERAVDAAFALRTACRNAGLEISVGVDVGAVYLFPMERGCEFAGDPVNRASKLAEDLADPGSIALTARAAMGIERPMTAVKWSISGIELDARLL